MVDKANCKLGITPVTKDEILRNLPKVIKNNVEDYKKQLKTATQCLENVKTHVDKLDSDADTIIEKCLSVTKQYKKLKIDYKVAKKFCRDSIFKASYSVNLVGDSEIGNVLKKAEERVKYNRLPATQKTYDLGDCIYWESLTIASKRYSDIVFATKDNAFIHNDDLHPHLRDELPSELSVDFFKNDIELTKHVRNKIPHGKSKYPDDLITSASTSASTTVSTPYTSWMQPFASADTSYFRKEIACPACRHKFLPDVYVSAFPKRFVVCPKCGNDFFISE